MKKTLNEMFRDVICLNEVGGDLNVVLRFTDPDGKPGRSGYSFGLTQMDTRHNDGAIRCLVDCGFSTDEIHGIVDQTIDVRPFGLRLIANKAIVAHYDDQQLNYCLNKAVEFNIAHDIIMVDTVALLAVADYVNQYGSEGEGIARFFNAIDKNRPVVGEDILTFKLEHTKYGREHRSDCIRRYDNILKVVTQC